MSKRSVKIITAPQRYASQLRDHHISTASTPKQRIEALGRDEKGRIMPKTPKPSEPSPESDK